MTEHLPHAILADLLRVRETAGPVRGLDAVISALQARMTDQNAPKLDRALGLHRNGVSLPRMERLRRRDAALVRLYRQHYRDMSATAAARLMAAQWCRYRNGRYPHQKTAPFAEPAAAWHALLEAGHEPLSAERIRRVLGQEPGPLNNLPSTR